MPFRPPLGWLIAVLVATSGAMTWAASTLSKQGSAIAAAAFALVLVTATLATNSSVWRQPRFVPTSAAEIVTPRIAIWRNAFLTMLAYLWSGATLLAIYLGSGVSWQHGWQYGSIMLLAAAGHAYYLHRISNPEDSLARTKAIDTMSKLAAFQAIAIGTALLWLIGSGKLETPKGDWAANQIFLAGGCAVMCISLIGVKSHLNLRGKPSA